MRPKGSADALELRRRGAVAARAAGMPAGVVAKAYGINRRSLARWMKARQLGGEDALAAKPHPGAKPKLDAALEHTLEQIVRSPATDHGFAVDGWFSPRLARVLRDEHGLDVHPGTIRRHLAKLNITHQRPQPVPRERLANAQTRADWVDGIELQLSKLPH